MRYWNLIFKRYQNDGDVGILITSLLMFFIAGAFCHVQADKLEDLVKQLSDRDYLVRCDAAEQLGELGDKAAVGPLIELLENPAGTGIDIPAKPPTKKPTEIQPAVGSDAGTIVEQAKLACARNDVSGAPIENADLSILRKHFQGLKSSDINTKVQAAQALGQLRDLRAVKALTAVLNERDMTGKSHDAAIIALGKIGDPKSFEVIALRLNQGGSSFRKKSAVEALGLLGDLRAIDLLSNLATSDISLRDEAINAICSIGTSEAVRVLNVLAGPPDNNDRKNGTNFTNREEKTVEQRSQRMREMMQQRGSGSTNRPSSLRDRNISSSKSSSRTSGGNVFVQRAAKEALDSLGPNHGLDPLLDLLSHNDKQVRIGAADALGQIADPIAEKALQDAAQGSDIDTRNAARDAKERSSSDVSERSIQNNIDSSVKVSAAEALGKIGDPKAVIPLVRAMNDENEQVVNAAAAAIRDMKSTSAMRPFQMALYDNDRDVVLDAIGKMSLIGNDKCVQLLGQALAHRDIFIRKEVVAALGRMQNPKAASALLRGLNDAMIRSNVIAALGNTGSKEAVMPLVGALKDISSSIVESAVIGLGKLGDERAVEPLIVLLRNNNSAYSEQVVQALRGFGGAPVAKALADYLPVAKGAAKKFTIEALGEIGDSSSVPVLAETFIDDPDFRESSLESLEKLGWKPKTEKELILAFIAGQKWDKLIETGRTAVPYLIDELDRRKRNYNQLVSVLGDIGDVRGIPVLEKMLHTWSNGLVVRALDKLGYQPVTTEDKVFIAFGRKDYDSLRKMWKKDYRVRQIFFKDIKTEDSSSLQYRVNIIIKLGMDDSVGDLLGLLDRISDDTIAIDIVNLYFKTGNKQLYDGGKAFCKRRNFRVFETISFSNQGSWGKLNSSDNL